MFVCVEMYSTDFISFSLSPFSSSSSFLASHSMGWRYAHHVQLVSLDWFAFSLSSLSLSLFVQSITRLSSNFKILLSDLSLTKLFYFTNFCYDFLFPSSASLSNTGLFCLCTFWFRPCPPPKHPTRHLYTPLHASTLYVWIFKRKNITTLDHSPQILMIFICLFSWTPSSSTFDFVHISITINKTAIIATPQPPTLTPTSPFLQDSSKLNLEWDDEFQGRCLCVGLSVLLVRLPSERLVLPTQNARNSSSCAQTHDSLTFLDCIFMRENAFPVHIRLPAKFFSLISQSIDRLLISFVFPVNWFCLFPFFGRCACCSFIPLLSSLSFFTRLLVYVFLSKQVCASYVLCVLVSFWFYFGFILVSFCISFSLFNTWFPFRKDRFIDRGCHFIIKFLVLSITTFIKDIHNLTFAYFFPFLSKKTYFGSFFVFPFPRQLYPDFVAATYSLTLRVMCVSFHCLVVRLVYLSICVFVLNTCFCHAFVLNTHISLCPFKNTKF